MLGREYVGAIRAEYRGFGHSEWSKAQRPEKYALQLLPEAYALVAPQLTEAERARLRPRADVTAPEPQKPRRRAKRRKGNAYMVRLGESAHRRLQTAMQRRGISSNQTMLETIILAYLDGLEEEAPERESPAIRGTQEQEKEKETET